MITRIVTVKDVEYLDTKDGQRQYMSATLLGDAGKQHKQSVFDPKIQKTINDAKKAGLSLEISLEKDGNFWNIVSAEILPGTTSEADPFGPEPVPVPKAPAPPVAPVTIPKVSPLAKKSEKSEEMTKDDWDKKDQIKRTSIERQVALTAAIQFMGQSLVKVQVEELVTIAYRFFKFISEGK